MLKKQYLLRKIQKKQVFEALREAGLQPADFTWIKAEVGGSLAVSRLDYRSTDYYFQFSWLEVNAWCRYCPGKFRMEDSEHPRNWDEQISCFNLWAQFLKQELDCPDVWEQLDKYRLILSPHLPEQMPNEQISGYEADTIGERLGALAERLLTELEPEAKERGYILSRIGYLADAAKRMRSADWVYNTLGVCVTVAATLSLSDSNTEALWLLFEEEIGQVIHLQSL
ncbi:hypothetical protein ACFL6U_06030 [Planctomycetota bacterium]